MKTKRYGLLLVVLLSVLVACAKLTSVPVGDIPVETEAALEADLSPETVESLWRDSAITIIDVREDSEFKAGHIPGALWIPLGELPQRLDEIPTDGPVVTVCRSGNRSAQALRLLQNQGFENAHNMLGGMNAWSAAGYEIEK